MISVITASRISSLDGSSACWVEITTVVTLAGRPLSYSTVTWDFPSGRNHSMSPARRASARRRVSRCARTIGNGIRLSLSRVA